jgi:hypothetical protein
MSLELEFVFFISLSLELEFMFLILMPLEPEFMFSISSKDMRYEEHKLKL